MKNLMGKKKLKVYKINYPENSITQLNYELRDEPISGAAWAGEESILNELTKPLYTIDTNGNTLPLNKYSMPWELVELDEAIDLAFLAIKKSLEIKNKILKSAMEEAPIDVLVISPKKSEWIVLNNPNLEENLLVQTC